ncbi:MAG: PEP-CTERM sorting domain-containing protein [Bryobacteraceae bacterium]
MLRFSHAAFAVIGLAMFSSIGSAAIIINTDQSASGALGTVQLPGGATGLMIQGTANDGALLNILGTETLTAPSNGQARVEAVDGSFTSLDIRFSAGQLFQRMVFNLDALATGTATFTAYNQANVATTVTGLSLSSVGQNFINVVASGPDLISRVTISSTVGLADIAQIRVNALPADTGINANAVPEPSTSGMIGGGMILLGLLRRKRS